MFFFSMFILWNILTTFFYRQKTDLSLLDLLLRVCLNTLLSRDLGSEAVGPLQAKIAQELNKFRGNPNH